MENKKFSALTAYLLIILLSAVFFSCQKRKDVAQESVDSTTQIIEKFEIAESKAGKPNWDLEAKTAEIIEKENKVLLTGPHIKFFENGNYSSTLKASRGIINTQNYDIWAEGKCVLTTVKGEILKTENLHYVSDTKKIVSDDDVVLIKKGETIYGKGLEATPGLETVIIKEQRVELNEES